MAYSPPLHDDSPICQMFCHACAAVSLVPTHVFARDAQEEPACPACASTFVEKQNIQQPTNSTRTNDAPGETSGRESAELSPFPPNFEMFLSGNATHNDEQAQQMYDEEQPRAMTDAEKATWRGYAVQLAWLVQF